MLILFNKATSVACFAMRRWQLFLLPHFSHSIDADTNVSAAHSLKLQRKIGWDLLWGGNPHCSLGGESSVSALLLSPVNTPAARDTSPFLWVGSVPVGTSALLWGHFQLLCQVQGHCWHPSLQNPLGASASLGRLFHPLTLVLEQQTLF